MSACIITSIVPDSPGAPNRLTCCTLRLACSALSSAMPTDADGAAALIRDVRARTDRPFNVNLFCHRAPAADAEREAQWLRYLAPEFERYGASVPSGLPTCLSLRAWA